MGPTPLTDATREFVATLEALVTGLATATEGEPGRHLDTARKEAVDLTCAFVDADTLHTEAELAALASAVGPYLPVAPADPTTMRRSGVVNGRRVWLTKPSALFDLLAEADRRDGGRRAWTYYRRALDLAHAVAAVDVHTSQAELDAISRFRSMLLASLSDAGLPPPPVTFFADDDDVRSAPDVARRGEHGAGAQSTPRPEAASAGRAATREGPRPLEVVLGELDELVGLDVVKAEVRLLADLLAVQKLREERGLPTVDTTLHLVFTGNPGTGKTTVGRLLAEIFATLGALPKGHLVETDRSELVAGYVGQTATRTREVCERALGGMLLVDEAYALARGSEQDFGREAIDTLVKFMEEHRERLAIVVAGYPAEMARLIDANPGLASRFPKTIHFPDYTNAELVDIFVLIARRKAYELGKGAAEAVAEHFDALPRGRGFGNGRAARNLFEAAVARHASRVVDVDDPDDRTLMVLLPEDVSHHP